jgi:glycerol kinase
MEAIAFLIADIVDRVETGSACRIDRVVAAGGAAKDPLLQCAADMLGREVVRSAFVDATALGCAFLAGSRTGFWEPAVEAAPAPVETAETFRPGISEAQRRRLLDGWHRLLRQHGILDTGAAG